MNCLHFIKLILLNTILGISTLPVNLGVSDSLHACEPATRGQIYTFRGELSHTIPENLYLLWKRNGAPVSTCYYNKTCKELNKATSTTIERVTENKYQYTLIIKNVTHKDEGIWTLQYLGLATVNINTSIFSCTLKVYAMSALTLHNCPNVVEENKVVRCRCGTHNDTEKEIDIAWFDDKGERINNTEQEISFVATRQNAGYQCRGKTSTGEEIKPLTYNPHIIDVKCITHCNKIEWNVFCTIYTIDPQPVCHFDIQIYDINSESSLTVVHDVKRINYTHEYLNNEQLYLKSQCTLQLPALPLLYKYNIVVNVNPNVTSDVMYSQTEPFSVQLKGEEVESENEICISIEMLVVICCVGLALFILFLVIALFIIKS